MWFQVTGFKYRYFWNFSPRKIGEIHDPNLTTVHIFQMGGEKPPTRFLFLGTYRGPITPFTTSRWPFFNIYIYIYIYINLYDPLCLWTPKPMKKHEVLFEL